MILLRLVAYIYLFMLVVHFTRFLLRQLGQAERSGPEPRRRTPPPPFGNQDPFGPFGPFGASGSRFDPFEQARRQAQQGQSQSRQQQRPSASPPREKSAYEILDVAPGASQNDVRRAYQAKVRQYHPDRTADLAPELRELAERRTKEITNAYNQLKRLS